MKKKGTKKHKSFFLRLALIGFFGFLCYGVVSFFMLQMDLAQKDQELQEINQKIQTQKQTNQELKTMLGEEHYSEYIARVAREKLGYVYPDERIFVDVSGS